MKVLQFQERRMMKKFIWGFKGVAGISVFLLLAILNTLKKKRVNAILLFKSSFTVAKESSEVKLTNYSLL